MVKKVLRLLVTTLLLAVVSVVTTVGVVTLMDKNRNELPQQPDEVPESFCFVIFDECGGNNDVINREVAYGKTVKIPTPPKRTGYEFDGWYTKADYSGEPFDFNQPITDEEVRLYAKWKVNWYTVSFYDDEECVDAVLVQYRSSVNQQIIPDEKTGYEFMG